MGVQLDLILPPIIVGFLIILIFRVNAMMMDSSVDTRLTNDVQTHSNLIADIIQEELRGLITYDEDQFDENHTSEEFEFVKIVPDPSQGSILVNVRIERDERNLIIYRDVDTITEDSEKTVIPSQMSNLRFSLPTDPVDDEEEGIGDIIPNLIHFHIETESNPEHHVRFHDDKPTVKAVSEREVYLRNRALINLPPTNDDEDDSDNDE
jgi:hypothetical protein